MGARRGYIAAWWILACKGKATQQAVYSVLAVHADRAGRAWPSIQTIATMTGISKSHVSDALRKLEVAGIVRTEFRPKKTSLYTLAHEAPFVWVPQSGTPGDAEEVPQPGNPQVPVFGTAGLPESGTAGIPTRRNGNRPCEQTNELTNEQQQANNAAVGSKRRDEEDAAFLVSSNVDAEAAFVARLVEIGVMPHVARRLLQERGAGEVERQLTALPFRDAQDPARMIVAALKDRWEDPPGMRNDRRSLDRATHRSSPVQDDIERYLTEGVHNAVQGPWAGLSEAEQEGLMQTVADEFTLQYGRMPNREEHLALLRRWLLNESEQPPGE